MSDVREAQLTAMTEAGQKLAIHWGHQPWSDSWARLVAETLLEAALMPASTANAPSEEER